MMQSDRIPCWEWFILLCVVRGEECGAVTCESVSAVLVPLSFSSF